uniref:Uncharacterized protein n=1 Tax=Lygus hesperus TaxID=30085 RepID=A0A0A9YHE0_LYGHE
MVADSMWSPSTVPSTSYTPGTMNGGMEYSNTPIITATNGTNTTNTQAMYMYNDTGGAAPTYYNSKSMYNGNQYIMGYGSSLDKYPQHSIPVRSTNTTTPSANYGTNPPTTLLQQQPGQPPQMMVHMAPYGMVNMMQPQPQPQSQPQPQLQSQPQPQPQPSQPNSSTNGNDLSTSTSTTVLYNQNYYAGGLMPPTTYAGPYNIGSSSVPSASPDAPATMNVDMNDPSKVWYPINRSNNQASQHLQHHQPSALPTNTYAPAPQPQVLRNPTQYQPYPPHQ